MTTETKPQSRYEAFMEEGYEDLDGFRSKHVDLGSYEFNDSVKALIDMQNKINRDTMVYLFGEDIGQHYWDKFIYNHGRNVLSFLGSMTAEARFFLMYQIKNDSLIYVRSQF